MKKRGFILIETIIVLVVVIVSMLGLYKSYSFLFKNLKQNKYYDNINDIYKLNSIKKNFVNGYPETTLVKITSSDCADYMSEDCTELYDILGIDYIIYNGTNIDEVFSNSNDLTNTDINYMKFLENNHRYVILHYVKNNNNYYSSLSVGVLE